MTRPDVPDRPSLGKARRLDLNLLRVFDAVMRHRSIAGAGRELHLTPSAISHALARLRSAVDDRLFIPGSGRMEPTERALELAPFVRQGLGSLEAGFDTAGFHPERAQRVFRIGASDYIAARLLPPLAARLATAAPNVDCRVFPNNRVDTIRHLDEGLIDVAVGWIEELPSQIRRHALWRDVEAVVVRPGHPLAGASVTKERLLEYGHVVVELTGSNFAAANGFLSERGVSRRVWVERLLLEVRTNGELVAGRPVMSVPHFGAVIPVLQQTDWLATLPLSYVVAAVERGELVRLELPYAPLTVDVEAIWHARSEADPAMKWFIAEILSATAALRAAPPAAHR